MRKVDGDGGEKKMEDYGAGGPCIYAAVGSRLVVGAASNYIAVFIPRSGIHNLTLGFGRTAWRRHGLRGLARVSLRVAGEVRRRAGIGSRRSSGGYAARGRVATAPCP